MVMLVAVVAVVAFILIVWLVVTIKQLRHKIFAVFLIFLLMFAYLSFVFVFKEKNIDYKTAPGLMEAGKIYFSWLGSVAGNLKSITSYAVHQNWKGNESKVK